LEEGKMEEFRFHEKAGELLKQVEQGAFLVVKGKEKTNVMTIGWALVGVMWRRPTLMVAVRTSRFTHKLIEEAESFTVSFPAGDPSPAGTWINSRNAGYPS
jgi:flavin reductase (DIM6/NTAB) family NADH-FMN oxidoreductase RutF